MILIEWLRLPRFARRCRHRWRRYDGDGWACRKCGDLLWFLTPGDMDA